MTMAIIGYATGGPDYSGQGELVASGQVAALGGVRNDEKFGTGALAGTAAVSSADGVAHSDPFGTGTPLTARPALHAEGTRPPPYGQAVLAAGVNLFASAVDPDIIAEYPAEPTLPPEAEADPIVPPPDTGPVLPPTIDPTVPPSPVVPPDTEPVYLTPVVTLPPCPGPLVIDEPAIARAATGDVQSLVTMPWHVWWGGILLGWAPPTYEHCGNRAQWSLTELTGWLGLPDGNAADTDRQSRWGSFPGLQTFGARTIEATFTYTGYGDELSLETIRRAFQPQEDPQETPLVIWSGTQRPEFVRARVAKASIPTDQQFSLGYHRIVVSWTATDPVRYGEVLHEARCGLPGARTGGLHFPTYTGLQFDLHFGDSRGGGLMTVTNDGPLNVWPTFEISGPVQGPTIEYLGRVTPGGLVGAARRLRFTSDMILQAGQLLTIDTDNRYAEQAGAAAPGVPAGTTGRAHLLDIREWFPLPPGTSQIRFTAHSDSSAELIARWRDAAIL